MDSERKTADTGEVRPHASRLMRVVLLVLGTVFVGIGIVGVFLPVLPTTPFLLLAAACYARASERCYSWLLGNPVLGPAIREWRRHRSIPRRTKLGAIALMLATFAVSIAFFVESLLLRVTMAAFALGLAVYLFRIPSRS